MPDKFKKKLYSDLLFEVKENPHVSYTVIDELWSIIADSVYRTKLLLAIKQFC